MLSVFPNSVGRHVEATGEWSTPFGRGGGFAPIIGDLSRLAVVEFGDADVSVESSVAVIAGPFDDDGVVEVKSSADFKGEFREVAFNLSDQVAAGHDFFHLWPLTLAFDARGTPRM